MFRFLFFFLLLSTNVFGQYLLEGTIVDKETGKPVPLASIGIVGTSKGTSSNMNGEFSILVEQPFSLKITCIGYESRILENPIEIETIQLTPSATQLNTVVVFDKKVNARKIMSKVFANAKKNYLNDGFLQKLFYRHYCKDNGSYGRLIEAYVDVWKENGYKASRKSAGNREGIRITQLRRSLDKTMGTQGHEPISVANVLQADLMGYQAVEQSKHMSFYTEVSNLKADFADYSFSFKGITFYDGEEVYLIGYRYKMDSVLTTTGAYYHLTQSSGTLYVTTDKYAIIKSEDVRKYDGNIIRTAAYYRRYGNRYYCYHMVRDGEIHGHDNFRHDFHIELMSVEVSMNEKYKFESAIPGRAGLLKIPYDPNFWTTNTTLKATPLENEIIDDLGGGASLNKQFELYQQYEINTHDGGVNGEEKLQWLLGNNKSNRIVYLIFWAPDFLPYLRELELAKQLNKQYSQKITFVMVSMDDHEENWKQTVQRFNFSADGMINYRIGKHSKIAKQFGVKGIPGFVLIGPNGEVVDENAKPPSDPLLDQDFEKLVGL